MLFQMFLILLPNVPPLDHSHLLPQFPLILITLSIPPPQWSASSTDDKLNFLAGIFHNHINNSKHENRVLAQTVANNTDNINSNTTNIQANTSDIQTLRKEATESEKKHEIVISGIPSCITQQLDLVVTAIFNKIGAHGLLNMICKIRLFKTPNQHHSNFTNATTTHPL